VTRSGVSYQICVKPLGSHSPKAMGLLSWFKGKPQQPDSKPKPAESQNAKPAAEVPGMHGAVEVSRPSDLRCSSSSRWPHPPSRSLSPATAPSPTTSSPATGRSSRRVPPTRHSLLEMGNFFFAFFFFFFLTIICLSEIGFGKSVCS
jgi:hypothetical protein